YFNMDDLQMSVDRNIDNRLLEVSRAEEIIDRSILEFEKWYEFRGVLPVVKEIRKYVGEFLDDRIQQTNARLKCASSEDREIVKASITSAVNSIMNTFIYDIKDYLSKEDMETYFRCLNNITRNQRL
ncbi:MAG: hypothetical protein FIA99_05200, partial [Ruminiclostridium sp.]|nr:hypothetical protein [Ruminiclostridium sp.]